MTNPNQLRRAALAAALYGLSTSVHAVLVQPTPTADLRKLAAVIAGPQRPDADKARDAARHPQATLTYFGLAANQTIVEITPGGGWYTRILAPFVRDHGHYYAALDPSDSDEARRDKAAFEANFVAHPATYGRVHVGGLPTDGAFTDIAPPGGADRVLTFRNLHNWMKDGTLDEMLRGFYAVLKPGGVLGIEEHRAPPETPIGTMVETGYLTEEFVIYRARAAGFRLAGHSEINANPRDDHKHPHGVWSLPPTLRGGDVDRDEYLAIGESDRMTLRFIKQAR
ncbi:MAG: class I SAM-dependent methyltransferase [Proteobacteria bacterium]|nr:class I SAM-dependent methyltransferase [Pseudomonadota bacterium]